MSNATDAHRQWEKITATGDRAYIDGGTADPAAVDVWCPPWCVEQIEKANDPAYVPHVIEANPILRYCQSDTADIPLSLHYGARSRDRTVTLSTIRVQVTHLHSRREPRLDLTTCYYDGPDRDVSDFKRIRAGMLTLKEARKLAQALLAAVELAETNPVRFDGDRNAS